MLPYIIKLSISLSIIYLFYQLFLRRLTFYTLNRWYLLVYSLLCFVIPFINVFTIFTQPALQESTLISYIPSIQLTQVEPKAAAISSSINPMQITIAVIITGMLLMIARLAIQYYSLFKMRSKAVLLYNDKVKLYHINERVIPFSFGRSIYVNQHQHTEAELKEIIRHEFIHVKQRHSLDIIWSELLCIINWYNPFAWLLRNSMRQNLEFIADQQVLRSGFDRKQYQYLLLKVVGVNSFSIAANFNFSSLKKRIAMMNQAKSAKVHLIRFLFILPLLVVILLAFRNTTQQKSPLLREQVTDTVPAKDIRSMHVNKTNGQQTITVTLKNGTVENYDLNNPAEKAAFESKYGSLAEPPKPPVPSAPPVGPKQMEPAATPAPPAAPKEVDVMSPPAPPAPPVAPQRVQGNCLNKKGYCITIVDDYGQCVVIIKNKNNKIIEAVTLSDWHKDKQYEKKYGEIPPPPPAAKPDGVAKQSKPDVVISAAPASATLVLAKVQPELTVLGKPASSPIAAVSDHASPVLALSASSAPSVKVVQGFAANPIPGVVSLADVSKVQSGEEMAIIDKYTTKDDLERISKTLKDNGFTLEVQNTDYRHGLLSAISLKVRDSNGKQGFFATTELNKMKIAICKTKNKDGSTGFFFQGK
jgi:hypothetical protein